jgi:hypothetical protein
MSEMEKALMTASTGSEEELRPLAYHHSHKVLLNVLSNKNVSEDLVFIIAGRRNIASAVLESIYNDIRWKENYRMLLALCKNPKTPQKISLSLLKSLRIFDQAELTRNQHVPINVRMRAEAAISEKNMKRIASHVIRRIADHPKWSSRYDVQWSLIRNNRAPLSRVVQFLKNIKTGDLRELYSAPEVPVSTKPFIFRELADRGAADFK